MTNQEIKTRDALAFIGYKELREISKSELDLSFKALSYKMNPETTTIEKYKDGKDYLLLLEYYKYLSDIKRTNETIRNILYPDNKTYDYQDEKPQVEEKIQSEADVRANTNNFEENPNVTFEEINIPDKPSILYIILSFIFPIFGVIMFILTRIITPKSSKFYLIFGIVGYVINFILVLSMFMNMK